MPKQLESDQPTWVGGKRKKTRQDPSVFSLDQGNSHRCFTTRVAPIHKSPPTLHINQIASVNWLLRWTLLATNEKYSRQSPSSHKSRQRKKSRSYIVQDDKSHTNQHRNRKTTPQRDETLLGKIGDLPDKRFFSIIKYIFWRWLTWANVIELILIVVLTCCLVYHCNGLLRDYYSYPSFVSSSKERNDNFWTDVPAITICSNNRISRDQLQQNFPYLNDSHFKAMAHGTFYSVDNFTDIDDSSPDNSKKLIMLDEMWESSQAEGTEQKLLAAPSIDYVKVVQFMSGRRVYGYKNTFPS